MEDGYYDDLCENLCALADEVGRDATAFEAASKHDTAAYLGQVINRIRALAGDDTLERPAPVARLTRSAQGDKSNRDRPLTGLEIRERRELVRSALIFSGTGKWKYHARLLYEVADYDGWGGWDLWSSAEAALGRATRHGISEVSFTAIPEGWSMVVENPYGVTSHPIMVRG